MLPEMVMSPFSVDIFFRLAVPEIFVGQPFRAVFEKILANEKVSG